MNDIRKDSVSEIRVKDFLSDVSRKERRYLLLASALGIIIVKLGLVPSRITSIGIEFSETNKESLLLIIATGIIYFIFAFFIYALSDFISWRIEFNKTRLDALDDRRATKKENREYDEHYVTYNRLYRLVYFSRPVSVTRVFFDFILPIMISVYALYLLFCVGISVIE